VRGKQRVLGCLGFLWTEVYEAQVAGEHDRVRLLLAFGMAVVDQYASDEGWQAAWRITGFPQSLWASWAVTDIPVKRAGKAHSRLLRPGWVATVGGAMRDEEVLFKRRGGKGSGKGKDKEKDKKEGE